MPLYDYECHKCGKVFEVRQKFSDEPLKVHEVCGGPVHRLLSVPSLQFKGTGWYVTDYGKGGKSPASNGSHETSEGKTDSKSESAPAKTESAKTESKPSTTSSDTKNS